MSQKVFLIYASWFKEDQKGLLCSFLIILMCFLINNKNIILLLYSLKRIQIINIHNFILFNKNY